MFHLRQKLSKILGSKFNHSLCPAARNTDPQSNSQPWGNLVVLSVKPAGALILKKSTTGSRLGEKTYNPALVRW